MNDDFSQHDPERVDHEMTNPASVDMTAHPSSALPVALDALASDETSVVLPGVCYPPSDNRSCARRMCGGYFRPNKIYESHDVLSMAGAFSGVALDAAMIYGIAGLTVRRALHDTDPETRQQPLALDPEGLRRELALSDADVATVLEQLGHDRDVVEARATVAAVAKQRKLLCSITERLALLAKVRDEYHRRRIRRVDNRIDRIKWRFRAKGPTSQQGRLRVHLQHLKVEASSSDQLLKMFEFEDAQPWDEWTYVGSPEWIDKLGYPAVLAGEDAAAYAAAFLNNCEEFYAQTWLEVFLVKLLSDLDWIAARFTRVKHYLLQIAQPPAAPEIDELAWENLSDEAQQQILNPLPLPTEPVHARRLALHMYEKGVTVVELDEVMAQIDKAMLAIRRFLEAENDWREKLDNRLFAFGVEGQKLLTELDLEKNGLKTKGAF